MNRKLAYAVVILSLLIAPAVPTAAEAGWGTSRIDPEVVHQANVMGWARYLIRLSERADLRAAVAIPDRDARRRAVVDTLRTTAERSQAGLLASLRRGRSAGAVSRYSPFWIVNAIAVESNATVLRMLARHPAVERIVPDRRHKIVRTAAPTLRAAVAEVSSEVEWNIEKVGAPAAWAMGIDGAGVVVASLDTGADIEHPAISGGYRGVDGGHDFNWWDAIAHRSEPYDDNGHGTHVTGTMAGSGGIGVAPGATWIAAKAFDAFGGGYESEIIEAGQFLAAPTRTDGSEPTPELAPDVVNNSWAGPACDSFFEDVVDAWRALDIFPAFAAGNYEEVESPADLPQSYAVGATDRFDEIAYWSGKGPSCYDEIKPEISAPGVDVRSSVPGGEYDHYDGTSMATPHVTGAVALVEQASAGSLTIDEIGVLLGVHAVDLGDVGEDNSYGMGRLSIGPAVEEALVGGTLSGVIADAATQTPIAGAEIEATNGTRTIRATAGGTGEYTMRLKAGTWTVTARAFGYHERTLPAVVTDDAITTLDFGLDEVPRVTVDGVVRELPSGVPLSGAIVRVEGTPLWTHSLQNGSYSLRLPPGTYRLSARAGYCRSDDSIELTIAAAVTKDFAVVRRVDAGGYRCADVPYRSVAGSTRLSLGGSAASAKVTLPFAFPFYGVDRTQAWITTAGYVSFAPGSVKTFNGEIPSAATPNAAVYGLWDALSVRGSARGVYVATLGSAPHREYVVEYRNFEVAATGDLVSFAIVLGEDGAIETHYTSVEGRGNGLDATIGLEDDGGSAGFALSVNEASLSDRTGIRYEVGNAGFVVGAIRNANDGEPVEGATVTAGGLPVRSRADGTFRLGVEPGEATVVATAPGYGPAPERNLTVAPGQTVTADFALPAPATTLSQSSVHVVSPVGGPPVTAHVDLGNSGARALSFATAERGAGEALMTVIEDAAGDGGVADVVRFDAGSFETHLTFALTFDRPIAGIEGVVGLDVDQDSRTGVPFEYDGGVPENDLGVEFAFELYDIDDGWVHLIDYEDYIFVGSFQVYRSGSTYTWSVSQADLGDDGNMNTAVATGTLLVRTDVAPDTGHGVIETRPDIPWLSVSPPGGVVAPAGSQTLSITVDPSNLGYGRHEAVVLADTNDPRRPVVEIPVTVEVPRLRAGIDAGGDGSGSDWRADQPFLVVNDFGYAERVPEAVTAGPSVARSTDAEIAGTNDDTLYRTQREGMASYLIRVPETGWYRLELGFAEIAGAAPGERVFDVFGGSELLLDDYDVAASAGANAAETHSFDVFVAQPWLEVRFVASAGSPIVNALRLSSIIP